MWTIWSAVESLEFSSLVYALIHDLQDYDPKVPKVPRNGEPSNLLATSMGFLQQALNKEKAGQAKAGYEDLRAALEYSRRVYLDRTKPSMVKKNKLLDTSFQRIYSMERKSKP